jgi:hypothetical protein
MLWMGTTPREPAVAEMLDQHVIGLMCQPKSNPPKAGWLWAADTGCFAAKWDERSWYRWLSKDHPRGGCLFATVPDVVADHAATMERWPTYSTMVRDLRYPVAFVAQDGSENGGIPWDEFDVLFVGGTTGWKQGPEARAVAVDARSKGKWVHVGRVNSLKRLMMWRDYADSSDGTHLAFEPRVAAKRVAGWVDAMRMGRQMTIGEDDE